MMNKDILKTAKEISSSKSNIMFGYSPFFFLTKSFFNAGLCFLPKCHKSQDVLNVPQFL